MAILINEETFSAGTTL